MYTNRSETTREPAQGEAHETLDAERESGHDPDEHVDVERHRRRGREPAAEQRHDRQGDPVGPRRT